MAPLRRRAIVLGGLGGFASLSSLAQEGPSANRPLQFALITPRAAEQTRRNWQPFIDQMAASVRRPIELRMFTDQKEMVAQFAGGQLDLAWMGNTAAIEVVSKGNASVFAQMVARDGSAGYRSVLVVPSESPLRSLGDVIRAASQLRFGDGDLKSTSGHIVPSYFAFQKAGVDDTSKIFKSISHESHQKNLMLAARREVDVATANNEELAFFSRDYPALAKNLRVVWESPEIPQSPLVWRTGLPADLRKRILQFTVNFGKTPQEKQILLELNALSAFRQSSNRQLVPVADLEMFKARQAINNDTSLSAQQRAQRIDEVIRQGSKLDLILKLSAGTPIR